MRIKTAEYVRIERLVKCALAVSNKSEAKPYLKQLYSVSSGLFGVANNILHELITATDTASGNVRDKERLKYFA